MADRRDSSGGYLTGDESERLWDREEDDAYTGEPLGDEDDGSASDSDVRIEAIWTRAHAISNEISEIEETLDRARSTTIFDPTELSIDVPLLAIDTTQQLDVCVDQAVSWLSELDEADPNPSVRV